MADTFAGFGRKRPQLNIPIDKLLLDDKNPRLAKEYIDKSQNELLTVLYEQFDLEELAYSMVVNGYFDEEPIVVAPINLPEQFDLKEYKDVNELQIALDKLVSEGQIEFKVLEGNRRTATAKLLTDKKLRDTIGVMDDFPSLKVQSIEEDLGVIPAIIYMKEDDVAPYLGIRHIAGNLRWEAYAKAVYLSNLIDSVAKSDNLTIEESIATVRTRTADRTDTIKKQYTAFKILTELDSNWDFYVKPLRKRFSLITEITNKPDIRGYLKMENYNKINLDSDIITTENHEEFIRVFTWVFGNGKDIDPLFKDSRLLNKRLAPILADSVATEHLIKYQNIEEAYERSGGEEKYFKQQIYDAQRKLENAIAIAYKFKGNKELIASVDAIEKAVSALTGNLK